MSYQGRLADINSNLLGGSGTTYYFKFSLWDSPTVGSGTRLWPIAAPGIATSSVINGVFNVDIGDTANGYPDPLTYDFSSSSDAYLQVEVASSSGGTYEVLSPRDRVDASGFAINANTVTGRIDSAGQGTFTTTTVSSLTVTGSSTFNGVAGLQGLTFVNATGTSIEAINAIFSIATATTLGVTNLSVGSLSGFLKATNGTVGTALSTDYVSSTAAGVGIVLSSNTGAVTITNNGVLSFNGATGTIAFDPYVPGFITGTSTAFIANSASSSFLKVANNLSDLNSSSTARTNLGIRAGTGLTFDAANGFTNNGVLSFNGATGTVAFDPYAAGFVTGTSTVFVTNSASSSFLWTANNLNDLTNTSTARTNIGFSAGTGLILSSLGVFTNNGVISLAGTNNQITVSSATGTITLSLPQSINSTSTPTFASATLSNFSDGSIIFTTSSGALSQDNSNLYWDSVNHRLGIGTTTPATLFSVATTTANPIFNVTTGGKVGIGTTTPSSVLNVYGSTTIAGALLLGKPGTSNQQGLPTNPILQLSGAGNGFTNNAGFIVTNGANIGISRNSAASTGIFGGSMGALIGNALQYKWATTDPVDASGNEQGTDTGLARSAAGIVKVTDGGTGFGSFLTQGLTVGTTTLPVGQMFTVATTSGSTYLTVLGSGKVGIGTSTPSAYLSVYQTATSTSGLFIKGTSNATADNLLTIQNTNSTPVNILTLDNAGQLVVNGDPNTGSNPLTVKSNGTQVLQVSSGGTITAGSGALNTGVFNVGGGLLHVAAASSQGSIDLFNGLNVSLGTLGGSGTRTMTISTNSTGDPILVIKGAANQTANELSFQNSSAVVQSFFDKNGFLNIGTSTALQNNAIFSITTSSVSTATSTLFTVLSGGNVGIGTTTPNATLTVTGSSSVSGVGSFLSSLSIGTSTQLSNIILNIKGSGGEVIRLQNGGNGSEYINFFDGPGNADRGYLGIGSAILTGATNADVVLRSESALKFAIGNSTKAVIDSSGNFGIGTTTPATLFSVATTTPNPIFNVTSGGLIGIGTSTPANILTIATADTVDSLADVLIGVSATSRKGLVVQAKGSQTQELFSLQNSSGALSFGAGASNGSVNTPGTSGDIRIGISGAGTSGTGFELVEKTTGNNRTLSWGINNTAGFQTAYGSKAYAFDNGTFFRLPAASTYSWSATSDPTASADVGLARVSAGLVKITDGGSNLKNLVANSVWVGTSTAATTAMFSVSTSSGTNYLTVTPTGNIGVGTTTPAYGLVIGDNTTQKDIVVPNGGLCVAGGNNGCPASLTPGSIYASSTVITNVDLAENYFVRDSSLEAGDVVAIDPLATTSIVKAGSVGSSTMIGIISTAPGLVLGGASSTSTRPVALAGRVPVKVNHEGGDIAVGDPLVLSSVPGVATKAMSSGMIIGYALQPLTATSSSTKITVFVNRTWYFDPDSTKPASFLGTMLTAFKGLGVSIEQDLLKVKNIIVDTLTAHRVVTDQFEMKDSATGQIYCVTLQNGDWNKAPGTCDSQPVNQAQQSSGGSIPPPTDTSSTTSSSTDTVSTTDTTTTDATVATPTDTSSTTDTSNGATAPSAIDASATTTTP